MSMNAAVMKVDDQRIVQSLDEAREKLEFAEGELILDFSFVGRVDPKTIAALKMLARTAKQNNARLVLRGASINIYKVLKLVKLAKQFTFAA